MGGDTAFWKEKRLEEMTPREWERLCDGCGWCCMHKFKDSSSDQIYYTCIACHLLDPATCRCRSYPRREEVVPNCLVMTPALAGSAWLPRTCAYRLLSEGQALPSWHHLVSGSRETVHSAGASVRGLAISEEWIHTEDLQLFVFAERKGLTLPI